MDDAVEIGGRRFTVVRFDRETERWALTPVRRAVFMRAWQLAGADQVVPMDGDDEKKWYERLQAHLSATPRYVDIAAAVLLPEGLEDRKFTSAAADETANFLRGIADADAAADVFQIALNGALDFFLHGVARLRRSQGFSEPLSRESGVASTVRATPPSQS